MDNWAADGGPVCIREEESDRVDSVLSTEGVVVEVSLGVLLPTCVGCVLTLGDVTGTRCEIDLALIMATEVVPPTCTISASAWHILSNPLEAIEAVDGRGSGSAVRS